MMNKRQWVCGVALLGVLGVPVMAAQAQQHHEDPSDNGMETARQMVTVAFVLPELQPELGLSAQQVSQLRQLKQEMLNKGKEYAGQIAAKRKELNGLVGPGTSKVEVVKRLFEEIGSLRGQQLFAGYETTLKMKAVLTEAQRSKLAAMKHHEFRQAMMNRMSVNDMMEMMQFMGGGETMDDMAMREGAADASKP